MEYEQTTNEIFTELAVIRVDRLNTHRRTREPSSIDVVVTQEKLAGDEIAPGNHGNFVGVP